MTKFNVPPKGGGARDGAGTRLSQKFTEGLLACFEHKGQAAIESLATDNPVQYLRFVSGIAPDGQGTGPLTDIPDDELAALLDTIRQALRARDAAGAGAGPPPDAQPPAALRTLRKAKAVP